jgi:S1-C subfamily serine protease
MLLVGCGGTSPPPPATPPAKELKPAAAAEPQRPKGVLWRKDVVMIVDAGFGRFLQRVEVEPSLEGNTFRGFRLVALRPSDWWEGVDLRAGDVVTSVNGMPIERETEAWQAFVSLKQAEELRVSYLRGGEQRELVYRIVAKGAKPAAE